MRCLCCNKELSDSEAVKKYPDSSVYLDMCGGCYHASDLPATLYVEDEDIEEYKEDV